MPRFFTLAALAVLLIAPASAQEVTGLSDWSLFLDPGHSQNENVGYAGYSEARKVLRIGLTLKDMLETRTDIEAVYISRTNEQQQVSLSQRVDAANASGADYFHSIHSNAAGPSANHLFILWPQLSNGSEPAPPYDGGRAMAENMAPALDSGMRIGMRGTNGGFGECDFYGASSCRSTTTTPKGSRNFVQSFSLMPSTLSEAGYHTSTVQNPRNMNAEWKVMEAQAMFWGILDFHGIPRTPDRIATGIITDAETGVPVNGATVTIAGQTYTTDTYESLFNQYTNDPDLLHNGFYYLPEMPAGTLDVTVEAEDYGTFTGTITMQEGTFTHLDVALVSTVPPIVEASDPEPDQDPFRITDPLTLEFSRPMDRANTEAAFELAPDMGAAVSGSFEWEDGDTRLVFTPAASLEPQTLYVLTLAGTATAQAGAPLDGDGDGTGGDAFELSFTTGFPDTDPPRIVGASPRPNASGVEARPIITLTYSEPILPETVPGRVSLAPTAGGADIPGDVQYTRLGEQSAISFFPSEALDATTTYRLDVAPGLEDLFLNVQPAAQGVTFTTGDQAAVPSPIDDFEGDVAGNWWLPQQSGTTAGIVTDSTDSAATTEIASLLHGGTTSFRLDYGWNVAGGSPWLIRQYLAGGAPRNVFFDDEATLRVSIFGDGSGTLFRFAVDDGPSQHEVSPWTPIDWIGWRTVDWDLDVDGTGVWIGNGVFDGGSLRFDSFQLAYDSDPTGPSAEFGQVWFDDLQLVSFVSTDRESAPEGAFALGEPFPNPVRQRAAVPLRLAAPTAVTAVVYSATGAEVARVAAGETLPAGEHLLEWDASGLAAGVYFVRVTADGETATARLTVLR